MDKLFAYLWNIIDPAVHISPGVTYYGGSTPQKLKPKVPLWKRILLGRGADHD